MNPPSAPGSPSTPPRSAERLLGALGADPEVRDLFLGDLAEEHAIRVAFDGERAASRWYWSEALRIAPYLLRDVGRRLRARDVARLVGVVLTAYACATVAALTVLSTIGSYAAELFWVGAGPLPYPGPPSWTAGALTLLLAQNAAAQLLGGYVAATLDARRPLVAALVFGIAWSGVHLASMALGGAHAAGWPVWLRAVQLALVVVAALLGGVLRVHTRRPLREDGEPLVR